MNLRREFKPSIVKDIGRIVRQIKEETGMRILLVEQFVSFAINIFDYYYPVRHGIVSREGEVLPDSKK